MQVHRFRDSAALALAGNGETRYMTAAEARTAGNALLAVARSIERESFAESAGLTVAFTTHESPASVAVPSARFSCPWPAVPGRYRVALYKGTFATTPVVYRQHRFSDHRTLKAACRCLASILHKQGRSGYTGERIDAAYIITPEGERLPLRSAQARINPA